MLLGSSVPPRAFSTMWSALNGFSFDPGWRQNVHHG
jgi:hypothetical protein